MLTAISSKKIASDRQRKRNYLEVLPALTLYLSSQAKFTRGFPKRQNHETPSAKICDSPFTGSDTKLLLFLFFFNLTLARRLVNIAGAVIRKTKMSHANSSKSSCALRRLESPHLYLDKSARTTWPRLSPAWPTASPPHLFPRVPREMGAFTLCRASNGSAQAR